VSKKVLLVFAFAAILGVSLSAPSNAFPKIFKNCIEMNKVYPGGIAKVGAVNQGGVTKNEPEYDNELYEANKKSDRDKDGIACEK
jgi:hypothetical protein